MKRSIIVIGELFLIAVVLYAAYLLVIPWRERQIETRQEKNKVEESDAVTQEMMSTAQRVPPERVASLFGWRKREQVQKKTPEKVQEAVPEAIEPKKEVGPEPITWMKPVGFALDSGSVRYQFFKDERTKRVLKLAVGVSDGGWKMIEATGSEFILEFEGKLYSVKRNP